MKLQGNSFAEPTKAMLLFVIMLNILFIALYLYYERVVPVPIYIFVVLIILLLITAIFGFMREKYIKLFTNLNISFFTIAIFCALSEFTLGHARQIVPFNISSLVENSSEGTKAKKLTQQLPFNPYAKLMANTRIHVPGDYGPADSFEYEWITDSRGYKNLAKLALHSHQRIIAIGDSFTEGFGVKTEQTWASLLAKSGYPTYSLGVQGYAPSQFFGTFEHFGLALEPNFLIIGYLAGDYGREAYFSRLQEANKNASSVELPSAIGRLVAADNELDNGGSRIFVHKDGFNIPIVIRKRHSLYISAAITMMFTYIDTKLRYHTENIAAGIKDLSRDARFAKESSANLPSKYKIHIMQRYLGEIESIENNSTNEIILKQLPEWRANILALKSIIELGQKNNISIILLFFHSRPTIYYEAATGNKLPASVSDLVEAEELRKMSNELNISFIDTGPKFRSYVANLAENAKYDDLPFLKYDGHPSPIGHELIADIIADHLKTKGVKVESLN